MPALARGQENTPSIINWFTTVNGVLTDMYEVGFQIWDITGGLPGSQVFPVADWENMTTGAGHYSVGHYYAYDNGNAQGWTPGLAEPIGTHRIKWRWKASAGSPYQSDAEDFEVLVQSAGSSADWYISVQDVRDEGLEVADYSDAQVIAAIETWQRVLERMCRQWFNPRTIIFSVDGNDSDTLQFGVPIISVDYVKLNGRTDELSISMYKVYNGTTYPDHRQNPSIKLIGPGEYDSLEFYARAGLGGRMKFIKGRQNQEIKAILGYVESDGSVPKAIKRALLKLVIEKLTTPIHSTTGDGSVPPVLGSILSETTDEHTIRYGSPGGGFSSRRPGLSGITDDPEILDIVKLYRAPIGLASPSDWSY